MAPSLSTATGIAPQLIDDPRLVQLCAAGQSLAVGDVDALVQLIEPWQTWAFEEQVDLHEWIHLLNAIDAALRQWIETYPAIVLVPRKNSSTSTGSETPEDASPAAVPEDVLDRLRIALRFLVALISNASSKAVFHSVDECVDLLGAADDVTADLALQVLEAVAAPSLVHKQQSPEVAHHHYHQHPTAIHSNKICHARLLCLARGWGSKAQGLGLLQVVQADDSVHGQGSLPATAGHVYMSCQPPETTDSSSNSNSNEDQVVQVSLTEADMIAQPASEKSSTGGTDSANKKRRITGASTTAPPYTSAAAHTKSTAELYHLMLQRIGRPLPPARQFALLADVRLARGFYSQAARHTAVERRLRAISTLLNAQPIQEVISSFLAAQPELCVEVVDLLRPTVSTANVSATTGGGDATALSMDAISGLAQSEPVPFGIRLVALDTLTALVSRRDGSSGMSSTTRLSNLLAELGVSKGQYLGLLPTLIRYSLSSLTVVAQGGAAARRDPPPEDAAMDVGLAFVEATREPLPPRIAQVQMALQFIEKVLTLTSTVVSSPTGTSVLTDCGLVPTLLALISADPKDVLDSILPATDNNGGDDDGERRHALGMVRIIAAQAVQILESAVVTHSHALTAFNELKGLETITRRLAEEMAIMRPPENSDAAMETTSDNNNDAVQIRSSQRVLLFSVLTCMAVIFHQQSTSSSASATSPTSSDQIKSEGLTKALIHVMRDAEVYGGHLVSLTATLLSDVMNSDPHTVRYVHESGIADAFLDLVKGQDSAGDPLLPAVPEMIMAIPNVISALALTDDGARAVLDKNPFPAILRLFYHPKYTMPQSRCLLNEMTAIIGTGLDEIMRHVERLKPIVLQSITKAIEEVGTYAEALKARESSDKPTMEPSQMNLDLEQERTCLIQYILNFGQLLEQLLHNEENCEPFGEAGGLDALLKLFTASLPCGRRLLAHICGLSVPSVSTLHHSTIEDSLSIAFKSLEFKYNSAQLLRKMGTLATDALDQWDANCSQLVSDRPLSCLQAVPDEPLYNIREDEVDHVANYLSSVVNVHWLTSLLASAIKAANGPDNGSSWKQDQEWRKELATPAFSKLFERLADFHSSSILDVCRARTSEGFEARELERQQNKSPDVWYRIRIVCPEGAVVRDGIDIDSCANVGSMEMGEIVESWDRCINSSGILRYHTSRGWVSEMTRGQSREPIAEVVSIWHCPSKDSPTEIKGDKKRREAGLPTMRTSAIGVLAKLQASFADFHGAISRTVMHSICTIPPTSISFGENSPGSCVAALNSQLSKDLRRSLNHASLFPLPTGSNCIDAGAALYLGTMLRHIHSSMFDEKRERRVLNFALLLNLLDHDALAREELSSPSKSDSSEIGILQVASLVIEYCLATGYGSGPPLGESLPPQSMSRVVASSLPPVIALLRRLVTTTISNSPVVSVMSRIKWEDIPKLVGLDESGNLLSDMIQPKDYFQPERSWSSLQVLFSRSVKTLWTDSRFCQAPPFIVHPVTSLVVESIAALEDSTSKPPSTNQNQPSSGTRLGEWLTQAQRQRSRAAAREESVTFEATEDSIRGLTEMGFSRDHAIDAIENSQSNRVEVAMEYALSHPPPSPESAERRRQARDRRAQEREERAAQATNAASEEATAEAEQEASGDAAMSDEQPAEKEEVDSSVEAVKAAIQDWLDSLGSVCVGVLTASDDVVDATTKDGNADAEAQATVVSSFLLDVCHRYPDRRKEIVTHILLKFRELIVTEPESKPSISSGRELAVATLCHTAVLFVRAIPHTRKLVLDQCLVRPLVSCLLGFLEKDRVPEMKWPPWIAPALLLLDFMAQPLVAFARKELSPDDDGCEIRSEELEDVRQQHLSRVASLSSLAQTLFPGEKADEPNVKSGFEKMPAYHPLLPTGCDGDCLAICRKLLVGKADTEVACSPGITHASLSLLLRLLRSPETATSCLRSEIASSILDLSRSSRFTGNTGLVAVLFRRLLEDKKILQSAMETEIQNAVSKLKAKAEASKKVTLSSFVGTIAPLMYRDPHVFLQAMALSVRFEKDGPDVEVFLVKPSERRNAIHKTASIEMLNPKESDKGKGKLSPGRRRRASSKSKIQRKRSMSKKRREITDSNESSPSHVIASLLIRRIVDEADESEQGKSFLKCSDLLDILADLVLAVPSCASAVHNYRPSRNKPWVENALCDAPSPSKTFVSYLLHHLLPQNRWSLQFDRQLWDRSKTDKADIEEINARKEKAIQISKLSQTSARLLVALVARPGEGRKRTISEISFALSAGHFGHGEPKLEKPLTVSQNSKELHALSAWGELCLGLAAPRSNGKTVETNGSLSNDIIKIMLEQGVAHALLHAIHRVPLFHSMAASTCSVLLLPFELLTRPAVSDSIQAASKDKASEGHEASPAVGSAASVPDEQQMDAVPDFGLISSEGGGRDNNNEEGELGEMDNDEMSADDVGSAMDSDSESDDSEMDDGEDDDDMESDIDDDEEVSSGSEVDDEGEWNVDYRNSGGQEADHMLDFGEPPEDGGTDRGDQGIDEGWTRIESSGFGGMFSRMVRGGGNQPQTRRGLMDAAETVIGSLLRTGEITQDTIAEIEGSLGININGGNSLRVPVSHLGRRESASARPRASAGRSGSDLVLGTLPQIQQRSYPEICYSSCGTGTQAVDGSSMEIVFGGPSVTSGTRYYDTLTPTNDDRTRIPALTHGDIQLFPGAPYAAASPQTHHSLHPLLCGVNLPPPNALVSDLLPHGRRSTRRGQLTTRRTGDRSEGNVGQGSILVSTANGDIMQTNRSHSGAPFGPTSRNTSGRIRWTDDGMPVDATVEWFSSAFQDALGADCIVAQSSQETNSPEAGLNSNNVASGSPQESQPQEEDNDQQAESTGAESVSVGEAVASSLANGLRLSPGNENEAEASALAEDVEMNEAESEENEVTAASPPVQEDPPAAPAGSEEIQESEEAVASDQQGNSEPAETNDLVCPPDLDPEVFGSLPRDVQQEFVDQHNASQQLSQELDGTTLDPEALAALPEELRQEVLAQERRRQEAEAPADPAQAEEMDNASFLVSLTPELREEILLTADDTFLSSLPPGVVAEAQILRERASARQRGLFEDPMRRSANQSTGTVQEQSSTSRRRPRSGKFRVELDRASVAHLPEKAPPLIAGGDLKAIFRLFFLGSPTRPQKLLQKILFNLSANKELRAVVLNIIVSLLEGDYNAANASIQSYASSYTPSEEWRPQVDAYFVGEFPPISLIETSETSEAELQLQNLPITFRSQETHSSRGSERVVPPSVSGRLLEVGQQLFKNSSRMSLHCLSPMGDGEVTCFDKLLDLLERPSYYNSSTNLEQLLNLLESAVSPLSHLAKAEEEDSEVSQAEISAATAAGKEWVSVPRVVVSQRRLKLLCSILRMETFREGSFVKMNTIVRRLCRIESNRGFVLTELATVAKALGGDAVGDLKSLRIRMEEAASRFCRNADEDAEEGALSAISGSVTLSTSASELKLLRVLETLQFLCSDNREESGSKRQERTILVSEELIHFLEQMHFEDLWVELSACLNVVKVLEGLKTDEVSPDDPDENINGNQEDTADDASGTDDTKKILRNNAAGLLTRFLPAIEAFFVTNASAVRPKEGNDYWNTSLDDVVDGQALLKFVSYNKVLLNALIRNNSSLLQHGFKPLIQVPRCRVFLDFDVKRQWFKGQVRKLRRRGSLRLHIRRKHVFEDAFNQLRHRNADEMRGRLHITFRDESGVDAGGLSREFFGILAKEMFNPNYALFTSTEDGCTFQPNPNSSINHEHLSYFRFVGRIVGKAVSDGYLLDAHFTRSLYKHMLGLQPTHHDMEAIDQDYYKNLKTILEFNLADLGLELTFSVEDYSFGRNDVVDLIPNGRSIPVTEDNKEDYVQKICQHRMTTAIKNQIKAYLDGFYELVAPEVIGIFTPGELELLISGLPDIDISDLKKHTDYFGWKSTDKQIEWFWNVMFSLSRNEKATFLQFVTGSSKVPLTGFADLQGMRGVQKFSLHKVDGKKGALMAAHTCFNSVDFPVYDSEEELREKLLMAINEGSGSFMIA